jgi:hypothetical protein
LPLSAGGQAVTVHHPRAFHQHLHDKAANNGVIGRIDDRKGLGAQRVEGIAEDANAVVVAVEREVLFALL